MRDCVFRNNRTNLGNGLGGAISGNTAMSVGGATRLVTTTTAQVVSISGTNCTFEENASKAGTGAIYSDKGMRVVDSVFMGNTAGTASGALSCAGYGPCLVERSRFEGNRSQAGGAIYSGSKMLTVTDSIFFDNVADLLKFSVAPTVDTATEGGAPGRFTVNRRVHASAIRAEGPAKISGSCFIGATGEIVKGDIDARGNFWTTTDPTVRGDSSVDSTGALTVAPPGCDPLRKATRGAATVPATYTGTATAGTDFVALPATLVFDPGVSTISLDVVAIFDEVDDNSESVSLSAEASGMAGSVTIRIVDGVPSDLRIVNTVDHETASVGDELVFTLTVTNDGPGPATNVVVTDAIAIPAGLVGLGVDFVVPTGASATCVPGPPTVCTIPVLAATQVASITVRARATAAGVIRNRAEVAAASDTKPANNVSEVVVTVSGAADAGVADGGAADAGAGDAGAADAGASPDASSLRDAGALPDGGSMRASTSGCGCRVAVDAHRTSAPLWLLPFAIVVVARRRRR